MLLKMAMEELKQLNNPDKKLKGKRWYSREYVFYKDGKFFQENGVEFDDQKVAMESYSGKGEIYYIEEDKAPVIPTEPILPSCPECELYGTCPKKVQRKDPFCTDSRRLLQPSTSLLKLPSGELKTVQEGEPCAHPGCLQHRSHPCEVCHRVGGKGSAIYNVALERQRLKT